MNHTGTVEVIRKPSINLMAMLSLLGTSRHSVHWQQNDTQTQPATPWSEPYGAMASSRADEMSVLLWNSNGTFSCFSDCDLFVWLNIPIRSALEGDHAPGVAMRAYYMDMAAGNPSALFDKMHNPYPTAEEFHALRRASELPSSFCLQNNHLPNSTCVLEAGEDGVLRVGVSLPQPSVVLLHVCHPGRSMGALVPPQGLSLRSTSTPGQVFVRWSDVPSRCIKSYELYYARNEHAEFVKINWDDTIFTAFVHQQATTAVSASGCYKLAWVDYWGFRSRNNPSLCIDANAGLPKNFVNA